MDPSARKHDVLLVDDDEVMGEATSEALECFEFRVQYVRNAEECYHAVAQREPSLILLDLDMPGVMGHEICRTLRDNGCRRTPIVALSGCQDDDAVVRMLEAGADDFVPKSQAIPILLAHIRAVLRRGERLLRKTEEADKLTWGPLQIDSQARRMIVEGKEIAATPTELRLLETFIASPGAVFTRRQLIDQLHGAGHSVTSRTVDVHINGLRQHLGKFRGALETVRGVGYRFVESPNLIEK